MIPRTLFTDTETETEYPEESGWTFTAFFLPKAFAAGFRLEWVCELIWTYMGKSLVNNHGFSLQDAMDVITEPLLSLAVIDNKSLDADDSRVLDCIAHVCSEHPDNVERDSDLPTYL